MTLVKNSCWHSCKGYRDIQAFLLLQAAVLRSRGKI